MGQTDNAASGNGGSDLHAMGHRAQEPQGRASSCFWKAGRSCLGILSTGSRKEKYLTFRDIPWEGSQTALERALGTWGTGGVLAFHPA